MQTAANPPPAERPVLSTMTAEGRRRWLRPRLSRGRFLERRRWMAYALILLFTAIPYVRIRGKPAMLFDLPRREFTLFGTTFLPTDTLLLALLLLSIFIAIFLLTALFGRVWCGWGCPQTVYMEFVYRPLERLLDGRHYKTNGRAPAHPARLALKYALFFGVSLYLAHTFLAYFVGVDRLAVWIRRSPFEHPGAFAIMALTTGLMLLDFCYMREQVCTLLCPYGRFQSVLLDRQSLIVGYDPHRGEPRGKLRRGESFAERGDCVDCSLCVTTCPTGIDIREGLQMECVGCAQCIDACDAVMARVGRPRGLIRYSSQLAMRERRVRVLRPRVVVYPLLLAVTLSLFGIVLAGKGSADVSFLRNRATPYRLTASGDVENLLLIKIVNRSQETRTYDVQVPASSSLRSVDLPLTLAAGASGQATLHVVLPRGRFADGRAAVTVEVTDGRDFQRSYGRYLLGPLYGGAAAAEGRP